jgi:hypothetical protein
MAETGNTMLGKLMQLETQGIENMYGMELRVGLALHELHWMLHRCEITWKNQSRNFKGTRKIRLTPGSMLRMPIH